MKFTKFIAEYFNNGLGYRLAARVGLLSRNVKITNGFIKLFSGSNIKVSNVNMKDMGLFPNEDPSFGIDLRGSNSSYVKSCTFTNGYSLMEAIDSQGLLIEENVLYNITKFCFKISSTSSIIRRNMIVSYTHNIFEPTGAISVSGLNSTIEDNFISSASISYSYLGIDCTHQKLNAYSVKNNNAINSETGVEVFKSNGVSNCFKISNFIIMYSKIGVYYQGDKNFLGSSNILVGNVYPIFSHIHSPGPASHIVASKLSKIENNLIVGHSNIHSCQRSSRTFGIYWPIFVGPAPKDM